MSMSHSIEFQQRRKKRSGLEASEESSERVDAGDECFPMPGAGWLELAFEGGRERISEVRGQFIRDRDRVVCPKAADCDRGVDKAI